MPAPYLMVDVPPELAPIEEWRAFLRDMQELVRKFGPLPELRDYIAQAEKAIRDKS